MIIIKPVLSLILCFFVGPSLPYGPFKDDIPHMKSFLGGLDGLWDDVAMSAWSSCRCGPVIFWYESENKLLLMFINFTPETSHSCFKKNCNVHYAIQVVGNNPNLKTSFLKSGSNIIPAGFRADNFHAVVSCFPNHPTQIQQVYSPSQRNMTWTFNNDQSTYPHVRYPHEKRSLNKGLLTIVLFLMGVPYTGVG